MTLSACFIVKDEESVIARALNCAVKIADEIIVVDTGSVDSTVEEAKKFTDDIYFIKWRDDFSYARNYALDKATCDYVIWLDADDVISDEDCKKIKNLVDGGGFDMAYLPYIAAPNFVYYRERIFRRDKNYRFSGFVHEAVAPFGKVVYSDAKIHHKKLKEGDPLRNLRIYQNAIARGICLDERSKFYYGRELMFNKMYVECIAVLEDFLKGDGWVENKIEACHNLYSVYTAVGESERAVFSLLRSFVYAPPRSKACCILGSIFSGKNDVKSAIYWYERALNSVENPQNGGFIDLDFCGYIPYMELCVLYDKIGDFKKANEYNEAAGKIKPLCPNYLSNKKYFEQKLKDI